ncbi:hypothetical protein [Massilia sp. BJB1822]|uniref:hypothetical protein n=1 Tax=Massilia sp. BJB1822 TaxID=2744470 RepID=UPI001593A2D6|nr:hypothetical protein [Massilia sp. BJB1822]NVE01132.1 hypothetical protein [Massilia sp. BJB1822]
MKFSRITSAIFSVTLLASSGNSVAQALELQKLSEAVWDGWSGGCWFHNEFRGNRRGGELMLLIRGEDKDSVAVLKLDGKLEEVPYAQTLSKSKTFRMGARNSTMYQSNDLKIKVTTIVTEVPDGNSCAGDCIESSGYAAEIEISKNTNKRKYKFGVGACGL